MGKSTVSMAMFNSKLLVYQAGYQQKSLKCGLLRPSGSRLHLSHFRGYLFAMVTTGVAPFQKTSIMIQQQQLLPLLITMFNINQVLLKPGIPILITIFIKTTATWGLPGNPLLSRDIFHGNPWDPTSYVCPVSRKCMRHIQYTYRIIQICA